ncbi:ferritin family protein [bacterium]|nr:ferritin family protein [bacterium]
MAAVNPLEYAIQLEQDGQAFYTQAAAGTTNPLGKKMFEGLAADETRHERILRQVAEDMQVTLDDELPKDRIVTLFATLGEELRSQLDAGAGDTDVIDKALVMEKAAEAHFRTCAAGASDDLKALYERLALEESQHVDILENTKTYLNDTGHWFFWDEGSVLDGG